MKSKKAIGMVVGILISVVMLVIMAIVVFGFTSSVLFGGPEYTAFDKMKTMIDAMCEEDEGTLKISYSIYAPDASGTDEYDTVYFYYVIHQGNKNKDRWFLKLKSRPHEIKDDWAKGFVKWVKEEGERVATEAAGLKYDKIKTLKAEELKSCYKMEICGADSLKAEELKSCYKMEICGADSGKECVPGGTTTQNEKCFCDGIQFESEEGKEQILFTVSRTGPIKNPDMDGAIYFEGFELKKS